MQLNNNAYSSYKVLYKIARRIALFASPNQFEQNEIFLRRLTFHIWIMLIFLQCDIITPYRGRMLSYVCFCVCLLLMDLCEELVTLNHCSIIWMQNKKDIFELIDNLPLIKRNVLVSQYNINIKVWNAFSVKYEFNIVNVRGSFYFVKYFPTNALIEALYKFVAFGRGEYHDHIKTHNNKEALLRLLIYSIYTKRNFSLLCW